VKSNLVDICVEIAAETDKAVLVHEGDKSKATWLPRSQIEIEETTTRGIFTVTLPEWLATDKGLL
jgi:hypothetical protein